MFSKEAMGLKDKGYSYSKLDISKRCPFRYKAQYIDKLPTTNIADTARAVDGSFYHKIFEYVFTSFVESGVSDLAHLSLLKEWVDIAYARRIAKKDYTESEITGFYTEKDSVYRSLMRILVFTVNNKCKVYVEKELALDVAFEPVHYYKGDVLFKGKMDLVLVAPDGTMIIMDHKSGYPNIGSYGAQLLAYEVLAAFALAPIVEREHNVQTKRIQTGLNFFSHDDIRWLPKHAVSWVTTQMKSEFVTWINKLSADALEGKIKRGRHCNWCSYRGHCGSKVGTRKKKNAGQDLSL